MRKIVYRIQWLAAAFSLLLVTGCGKDFLDINTDPNNPRTAPLAQVLPYAQLNMTNSLGFGGSGLSYPASGFVHQTVTRDNFNTYFALGNDFAINQAWDNLYAGALTDYQQIIDQGTQQNNWHFVGIAQILRAYTFSQMVDTWGDIPFTQANLGSRNPYPAFDPGQQIYPQLITLIDEGIANLAKTTTIKPGAADLFFGGDPDKWRRFGNSLKLRLYNNARLTSVYDPAAVAALLANPDANLMDGGDDDFELLYGNTLSPNNRHPAFIQEYTQGGPSYFISPYFYQIMQGQSTLNPVLNGIEDPRIPYYFYNQLEENEEAQNPTAYRDGGFVSIWFGSLNVDPNEGWDQNTSQTVIGLYPAGGPYDAGQGDPAGPNSGLQGASVQRLYTYFTSLYVRAELALTRGTGEDARKLFEDAMVESFAEVNRSAAQAGAPLIDPDDIKAYVAAVLERYTTADANGKLELLLTEKWIANFGFALESYSDIRRTGFPRPFDPRTDNNPVTVLNRDYIVSFPYPVTDLQLNPNAPGPRNIATDRVFWDQN
jgi:hypothetical protein